MYVFLLLYGFSFVRIQHFHEFTGVFFFLSGVFAVECWHQFCERHWGSWEAFIEVFCWQTNQTFRGFQRQENYFLLVDNGTTPQTSPSPLSLIIIIIIITKGAEKLLLNCSVDKQERLRGTFVPRYLFPGHQGAEKGLTNKENLEGLLCQEDYFPRAHYPSVLPQ